MTDNKICQTCTHWRQYQDNKNIGRCVILGAIEFNKPGGSEIALTTDEWTQSPVTDFLAVRTEQYFGCIKWRAAALPPPPRDSLREAPVF